MFLTVLMMRKARKSKQPDMNGSTRRQLLVPFCNYLEALRQVDWEEPTMMPSGRPRSACRQPCVGGRR